MEWTTQDMVQLVSRWLHILGGMTALGGMIFARLVVFPTLCTCPDDERQALHAAMRARWSKVVSGAIGLLLITGLYNYARLEIDYALPAWYRGVFGVKFILALTMFTLASLLAGRSAAGEQLRAKAGLWLGVNLTLGVAVVCLSGVLRSAHTQGLPPKPAAASLPAAVSAESGGEGASAAGGFASRAAVE